METVPHVVLEYDKWSDCALVALTDDAHSAVRGGTDMPYLVTSGYHRESRTWARATPFGDITRAKVVFEHRVGRDYAPNEGRLHDDEVIACRWRRGDIAGVLEESLDYPIPATKENIDTAIGQIAHVRDRLIEYGWREMVDSIRVERLDLGLGSCQADNFYRGVYDVTAHHNSMFWPSGDGNAVLGPFELGLQFEEILVGLQVGILLRNGDQTSQSRSHLLLRLLKLGQLLGRQVRCIQFERHGLGTGFDHLGKSSLLMRGIALDGIDQIGDQVGTTLVLRLDIGPGRIDGLLGVTILL